MYAAVGLGVAIFANTVRGFRYEKISVYEPKMGQAIGLDMVSRVYTWLPYFSYMGFAVWVSCVHN
jgi:hypothetical protein